MPFKKGEVANPNGRPKGSRNKKDIFMEAITKQALDGGILPLDFMLQITRDETMPVGFRFECAKAAAPYCHRKMPQAVEVQTENFKVFDPTTLQGLSIDEMQTMAKLLRKAHEAEMDALNGGVTIDGTAHRVAQVVHQLTHTAAPSGKPKPTPKPRS